jgi:uncharacterized RDD family membrane protein YckC
MDTGPEPSLNPYAPPMADIASEVSPAAGPQELASRWQRLGGALVDGLLGGLAVIPAIVGRTRAIDLGVQVGSSPIDFSDTTTLGLASTASFLSYWGLQSYFIATRGQSVGKIVAGTRIVAVDGSRASFARAVLVRTWAFLLVAYVPLVGGYVVWADFPFIFGSSKRCLHDFVAGTKVVRVASPDG